MAWRGNADVTRHPAEDDTLMIPCDGRFAQGPNGASYPARPTRLLRSHDRRGDPPLSTRGERRADRW
jgi:hypothetical protein